MITLGLTGTSLRAVCMESTASLCHLLTVLTPPFKVALPAAGMFKLGWRLGREWEIHLSSGV